MDSRQQFEYEAGQALNLPTSIIELARKDEGYDHAFDSMNIMQPLNVWWAWWKKSRAEIVVALPEKVMVEDEFDNGHNCAIDYCSAAIRAAGIIVKGDS